MKKAIILTYILLLITFSGFAGTDSLDYPRIGQPCPDFLLEGVEHFEKNKISPSDFRGKWLILDFWGEYCSACVASFPKMNEIQQEFSDELQIIFVGIPYKGNRASIRQLYEKHRKKLSLGIPIAYDNELASRFKVGTYPHIVVVNPDGIVRYITLSLSKDNIQKIIDGDPVDIPLKYNTTEKPPYSDYNTESPFLIGGNGGNDLSYYYRSVLAEATDFTPPVYSIALYNKLEILGVSLRSLYKYAYMGKLMSYFHNITDSEKYGKFWPEVLLETSDTSLFSANYNTNENLFSYAVHVNDQYFKKFGNVKINFHNILKKDLEALFPYSASLEKRMMPCYKLYIDKNSLDKLKSKSDSAHFEWIGGRGQGFRATKFPMVGLISRIVSSPGYDRNLPLSYDGENIEVDLEVQSIYFDDMKKELKELGIEITKEQKEMSAVVIRDKEN